MRIFILMVLALVVNLTLQAQSKLSPKFFTPNERLAGTGMLRFSVSMRDVNSFCTTYKNKMSLLHFYRGTRTAIIKTTYETVVNDFVKDSNIFFVDILHDPTQEGGAGHFNQAFNKINVLKKEYPALHGAEQRILIKEQQFDTASIDLAHKSFETTLASPVFSQHATTIATIIAGSGNSSENATGVASDARIGSSDFANLLPDDDLIFTSLGIRLENHSYGVGIENYYGNEAAAYDDQVYRNPAIMHVFSAGNSGNSIATQGTYGGLSVANLSGNFKQAKNILTVTAVDTSFNIDPRNSRGPAYDGRVKPELTAYGQDGTSDAAAIVTGVCALLQEHYLQLQSRYPTASEVKSILIASTDDIDRTGIDYTSGYGSINADRAIRVIDKEFVQTGNVGAGKTMTIDIHVPAFTHQLRVAVVWTDPPAQQNDDIALVHDVDAVLHHGIDLIYPWTLNSLPSFSALNAAAVRKPDHLNNIEYFTVDDPGTETYNLVITAPDTVLLQEVSVAYWFEESRAFQWTYPASSDKLKGGQKTMLIWNAQSKAPGKLYLKLGDGEWNVIADNVNLETYFAWTPPDTLATAQLKMTFNDDDFISDPFIISDQPKLSVVFDCPDQLALTWKPVPGATNYEVYTYGRDSLELLKVVSDTLVVIPKTSSAYYFAVAPRRNLVSGIRSETINYIDQGAFCYINLFDAQRYEKDIVTLQLNLGTILNVAYIQIFKMIGDSTFEIARAFPDKNLRMTWYDDQLHYGVIRYQALIVLASGAVLTSDIREIYIEKEGMVILFPNPVGDDGLKILSEGAGLSVRVINLTGETMIAQALVTTLDSIDTRRLPPGIYVLQLLRGDRPIDNKRFLKI